MLSPDQLAIIKQTVPVLQANGELLTRHFYQRLFRENPEVLAFFNPAHQRAGSQQRALAGAILAYAQNIENPAVLGSAVELIAQKHVSLGIQPEHYPVVGANLLGSIREVLGDAATDAVIDAWTSAYGQLADIFIAREAEIYAQQEQQHGWRGFKRFVVARREPASDNIVSLYLQAEDGQALRAHRPGQYLTLRVSLPDGQKVMRNYSISNRPGSEQFRISVKRERALQEGAPHGVCSSFLHERLQEGDVVEISPPCGEFTLQAVSEPGLPLVLIAGGVGITPVLSMLHAALAEQEDRGIVLIQCAVNGATRPFAAELASLQAAHRNLQVHVRFSEPSPADRASGEHDSEGFLDDALLASLVGVNRAEYYLCGPTPMLQHGYKLLRSRGVQEQDIHYEFFGPASALAA